MLDKNSIAEKLLQIRVEISQDVLILLRPKIDRGGTLYESQIGFIKPVHKLAKFVNKISSKVYKPKTYNKAINDSIYGSK